MRTSIESWLLSYLANAAWQSAILYAVAWAIARTLRRLGPRAEHRVWVAALLMQVLLPALIVPPVSVLWGDHGGGGIITTATGEGIARGFVRLSTVPLEAGVALYMALLLLLVARLVWNAAGTQRLARRATPAKLPGDSAAIWQRCCADAGVTADVRVSGEVNGPVTVGVLQRLLLLPPGFAERVDAAQMEAAMAHECAHMQRSDFAKNLVYEVMRLPLAWHPGVWATHARLAESREMVCDAMAAQAIAGERDYARALLQLATSMAGRPAQRNLYAIGIFDANHLERRIMRLSEGHSEIRQVRRLIIAAACVVAGLGTCATAAAFRVSVAMPAAQAVATDSKPVRVSAGVMAGTSHSKVAPKYPAEAKARHISGSVVLRAVIGKDGLIHELEVVSGPEELRESALEAVKQWTYEPYMHNGEPTEVETTITVNYALAGPPPPAPPAE